MKTIRETLPQVAVLLRTSFITNRELIKGMLEYTRIEEPWMLSIEMCHCDEPGEIDLEAIRCAGIVTDRPNPSILDYAHRHRVPIVTVLQNGQVSPEVIANVTCDDTSVARLAATHLVDAGFRNFAYVVNRSCAKWSADRLAAFRKALAEHGFSADAFERGGNDGLADFLVQLPKPCGVFVANDKRAIDVLRLAYDANIAIPDEIAVISVDNDDIVCETARPTLSSIPWDTEKTGYEAARLLDEAISKRKRNMRFQTVMYHGTTVVARRSSAHLHSADALVRKCLILMELNFSTDISVDMLAKHLNVSRRTLERRFLLGTGESIAASLLGIRMAKATNLIKTTGKPLDEIADLCGFCDASHLVKTFKRRTGATPSSLRSK